MCMKAQNDTYISLCMCGCVLSTCRVAEQCVMFLVFARNGVIGEETGEGGLHRDDKQPLCLFDLNLMLFNALHTRRITEGYRCTE